MLKYLYRHFHFSTEIGIILISLSCLILGPQYGFVGRWLSPGRDTVGALDFGGASTQITFETSDRVEDKSNRMELRLYGQNYSIYTQSFLCFGRDQVLRQLLAHLVKVTL